MRRLGYSLTRAAYGSGPWRWRLSSAVGRGLPGTRTTVGAPPSRPLSRGRAASCRYGPPRPAAACPHPPRAHSPDARTPTPNASPCDAHASDPALPTPGALLHTVRLLLDAPAPPRVLLAHTHRPLTSVLKGSGCMEHLFATAERRGVRARELYAARAGMAFVSLIELSRGEPTATG